MGKITTQFYQCEKNQYDALVEVKEKNPELADLINNLLDFYIKHGYAETYYLTDYGFNRLGHGAYKEAFTYGDYVIKFASEDNNTKKEYEILQAAEQAKVYGFCPTIFASCPPILLNEVDDENAENGDYDEYDEENDEYYFNEDHDCPHGVYILIQQRAVPMEYDDQYSYNDNIYKYDENDEHYKHITDPKKFLTNAAPRIANVFTKDEWYWFNISNVKWLENYEWYYNTDGLIRFKNFILDNHIVDLHSGNIGSVNGDMPVLFDWLS